MQKVRGYFLCSVAVLLFSSFIKPPRGKVQWLTISEVRAAYSKNPKPILVDVYTGWCGWCKVMDQQTYSNASVADYINDKYYPVKFDAESRDTVEWNGNKYSYNPQNKMNGLAVY